MRAYEGLIQHPAYNGAGNEVSFSLMHLDGSPLNLAELSGVVVTVSVHNDNGDNWVITSDTNDVYYEGNILYIKFGKLNLPVGLYYPRVSYTHSEDNEPEVIMARGKLTEMLITSYVQ